MTDMVSLETQTRRAGTGLPVALCAIAGAILALALFVGRGPATHATAQQSSLTKPVPVLAYYYIWYDPSSWSRAKTDYPLLGRYSSDDRQVMRKHIRWAKEAGIGGFIVGWKSTNVLNPRLEKLIEVAREEDFKLTLIYQALDFAREPLPVERVAADLDEFIKRFAGDPVFALFSKPVVIWSGTWKYSREEVAQVTQPRRDRLLVLASERDVAGYQRIQDLVDGNAYYWAAVDPSTQQDYQDRLNLMGEATHKSGGLWIAPAAPGFDARLIGGTTVVDRKDGETLRRAMDGAVKASPDAVGVISWNEFSENTHIEPSEGYGARYLEVLADIAGGALPAGEFDSSEPASTGTSYGLPLLGAVVGLVAVTLGVIVWRRRQQGWSGPDRTTE